MPTDYRILTEVHKAIAEAPPVSHRSHDEYVIVELVGNEGAYRTGYSAALTADAARQLHRTLTRALGLGSPTPTAPLTASRPSASAHGARAFATTPEAVRVQGRFA